MRRDADHASQYWHFLFRHSGHSLADGLNKLYTYPIKSLRSNPLQEARLTPHGFPHDRQFMLVKHHSGDASKPRSRSHFDEKTRLENMTITYWPELALFLQTVDAANGTMNVKFCPPDSAHRSIAIPLEPRIDDLKCVDVVLHSSPTEAYSMSDEINAWFSTCLGYDAMLVYLGTHRRPVLGNLSPNNVAAPKAQSSWLSSVTDTLPKILGQKPEQDPEITFADVAAYLVVTQESLEDVSSRLPGNTDMDITKFRPNIVVSGAREAYDEDYWGRIAIGSVSSLKSNESSKSELILTQNCLRCVSINVDYNTGRPATGEEGQVLKRLMKDRRVDKGMKWSPVFGRYGFLDVKEKGEGIGVKIGDEVMVTVRNEERTAFGEFVRRLVGAGWGCELTAGDRLAWFGVRLMLDRIRCYRKGGAELYVKPGLSSSRNERSIEVSEIS